MPRESDPFQRVMNDPTSLARVFFAVSASIETVSICAHQVCDKLDKQREERCANHETDLRHDSRLCEWVAELQEALSKAKAKKIEDDLKWSQ